MCKEVKQDKAEKSDDNEVLPQKGCKVNKNVIKLKKK